MKSQMSLWARFILYYSGSLDLLAVICSVKAGFLQLEEAVGPSDDGGARTANEGEG